MCFMKKILHNLALFGAAAVSTQGEPMPQERSQLADDVKWNVEEMYATTDLWENDYEKVAKLANDGWKNLLQYKGRLNEGPSVLKNLLETMYGYSQKIEYIYTYAHLRHDEDTAHDAHKVIYNKGVSLYYNFGSAVSWVNPEILSLSDAKLKEYLNSNELKEYRTVLQKLIDQKQFVLPEAQEKLMAYSAKIAEVPGNVFRALDNSDIKFDEVADSSGKMHPLSQGTYSVYLQSNDRTLRRNAFKAMLAQYQGHENTFAETLKGIVESHIFQVKARGYDSCLHAALEPHQIDHAVYTKLIESVNQHLPVLHKYVELRKKMLGVDELHFYDMYVPLVSDYEMKIPYEESVAIALEALRPLGKEYCDILKRGLIEEKWVDVYENENKRSGAYSSGCYGSSPYILMNYTNTLRDLKTLVHEAGHSMQTYLSNQRQPYQYCHYPIFVAEVASTFNEELTFRHLMSKATDKKQRIYLLCQNIEDVRATLFRQTMFAEFELKIHELGEMDIPITPAKLKEVYRDLNTKYFGPAFVVDEELDCELYRIPHFYYDFYVYQYATGMSAAHTLVERVMNEGDQAREDYLNFLSSGGSKYPLDLLRDAGADMTKTEPVDSLIEHFAEQINLLEKELDENP